MNVTRETLITANIMPPSSRPPPIPTPTGVFSTHKANCHCGAVRWTFSISPPLETYPVKECNCSFCQRNGYLLVYPVRENVQLEPGSEEAMGGYSFGNKVASHRFCKTCGSSVFFEVLQPPAEAVADAEARGEKLPKIVGMNVGARRNSYLPTTVQEISSTFLTCMKL